MEKKTWTKGKIFLDFRRAFSAFSSISPIGYFLASFWWFEYRCVARSVI